LLFLNAIETTVSTLPYKGSAPAMNCLLGDQLDFMCDQALSILPPARAGRIKAYAATTKSRIAAAPDLPTAAEGGLPGFEIAVWFGMYALSELPFVSILSRSR
jgi:tripartite-type tricarboxylate transporter receptor subunit TctC